MVKYKRIFIALAILLSGVSILPAWATPWPNFDWQRFADTYQDPAPIRIVTATPKDDRPCFLPDLAITEMRIETERGGGNCSNSLEPLGIQIWVTNQGYGDSGPFLVDVNGVIKPLDGLGSEMSQSIWFEGYINGRQNLAVVDVKNQVKECDEDNNQRSQMLQLPTPIPTCTPPPPETKIPDKPNSKWEAVD
jgi:hypothetical protein